MTTREQIEQINRDIEIYKQAIRDAEDALAAAEIELNEVLEERFENAVISTDEELPPF